MGLASLYEFLCSNEVTEQNSKFIKNHLEEIESEAWGRGYSACLLAHKKRRQMQEKRRSTALKRFLDFLNDLTHDPKKKV